jgi:hypothetical protein
MKTFSSQLLFLFVINCLSAQTEISIDSVSSYIGIGIKVCDQVTDAFRPQGEDKITYLNFGGKYPNHKFTVVIFAKDLPNFPFNPVEKYKNKKICVTGMGAEYKDSPQIVVRFPEQIEIQ